MDINLKQYKVVLTGFGPFQEVKVNESWLAVSKLWEMEWPNKIRLVTRELPVDYNVVKEQVKLLWDKENPDLMIHVGVDRGGNRISIERCSFNDDYQSPDVSGNCPNGNICVENGSDTLETKLNVKRLLNASNKICQEKYSICEVSDDPGRFLCGFIYYLSLHQDSSKSLFVHVPSSECLTIDEMAKSLREIIFDALDQLYECKVSV